MAKRHDFSYFFHEGLSNMFSHGFMSFAAIGITVACLLIMGTFTLVAVNANELLTTLEQENEILAYVDDSYTETQARALKSRLEAIPNVASVTFISRSVLFNRTMAFLSWISSMISPSFSSSGLEPSTT